MNKRALSPIMRALPVFFSARVLALVSLPLVAAAFVWLIIVWFAWEPLVGWLARSLFAWSERFGPVAAAVLAAVMFMLAAVVTALVAIAVLAMPVIVEAVGNFSRRADVLVQINGAAGGENV